VPKAVWAIVVAGGEGRRFGGAKQFMPLRGQTVLERSVTAARSVASTVVAVVPASCLRDPDFHGGADLVVAGGDERAASVRAGLAIVPEEVDVIVVHDAARPLASEQLFQAVVDAVTTSCPGAIPALALADTVKRVRDGIVTETLDRAELVAVQTPQAFAAGVLRRAHETGSTATDDAALVEAIGASVAVIPGEPWNLKLTDSADLAAAERYLDTLMETT